MLNYMCNFLGYYIRLNIECYLDLLLVDFYLLCQCTKHKLDKAIERAIISHTNSHRSYLPSKYERLCLDANQSCLFAPCCKIESSV